MQRHSSRQMLQIHPEFRKCCSIRSASGWQPARHLPLVCPSRFKLIVRLLQSAVLFGPVGITAVNVTSWHLDSARRFTAFPASKSIFVRSGLSEPFCLREEGIILYFHLTFQRGASDWDPSGGLCSPHRSSRSVLVRLTANEGAIVPKGVLAAYMWTLNVVSFLKMTFLFFLFLFCPVIALILQYRKMAKRVILAYE